MWGCYQTQQDDRRPPNQIPMGCINDSMDAIVKKVKELLEGSDPGIVVTEAEDPLQPEHSDEGITEPPVNPATV